GDGVAEVVVRSQYDTRIAAGGDHLAGIVEGQRQRFLAKDVFAGFGGRDGLRFVELVGGADVDNVDAGIGEEVGDGWMRGGDPVLLRKGTAAVGVAAGGGHDAAV